MRLLGVNGIWTGRKSEDSFTDRFIEVLGRNPDVTPIDVQYPRMTAFMAYFNSQIERRVDFLLRVHEEGDCVLAHSFGCLLTLEAIKRGAKFNKVFFFGAAVDDDVVLPQTGFNRLWNVHSEADRALGLGRFLPFHPFGNMGRTGYALHDHRVVNRQARGRHHSTYASPEELDFWCGWVQEKLL